MQPSIQNDIQNQSFDECLLEPCLKTRVLRLHKTNLLHRARMRVNQHTGVEARKRSKSIGLAPLLAAPAQRIMFNKVFRQAVLLSVFAGFGACGIAAAQTTTSTTGSAVQVTIPTSISQD